MSHALMLLTHILVTASLILGRNTGPRQDVSCTNSSDLHFADSVNPGAGTGSWPDVSCTNASDSYSGGSHIEFGRANG